MTTSLAFDPIHVEHAGRIDLPLPSSKAFPHFTPEGERAWVPGWDPEYLHPRDGEHAPGLAFRTRAHGEETLWLVTRFDAELGQAEYVRVTPGSRLGTVTIRCESLGDAATAVHVGYRLTATSPAGNAALADFDAAAFSAMLEEWRTRILALR